MTLQAPRTRPRIPRDCLTGQPLRAGLPVYVVHIPVHQQRARYLEASGDVVSAPLALNRHETEGVGLAYAVLMAKYLQLTIAEQQSAQARAEHLAMVAWWRDEYGIRRVYNGLYDRFARLPIGSGGKLDTLAEERAKHILQVVMTCHLEEADPASIAERFNHSEHWVLSKIDWCMKIANARRRQAS